MVFNMNVNNNTVDKTTCLFLFNDNLITFSYFSTINIGKHAKSSDNLKQVVNEEGEREPSLGALDKHTQKAKDAFSAAGNVLQSQVAIEEVKQELNKGGRGRVLFFFIIFIVNICLGKKKCRFYFETN